MTDDVIKSFPWHGHPLMRQVNDALEKQLPGWFVSGQPCADSKGRWTFMACNGFKNLVVYVNDQNQVTLGNTS